MLSQKLSEILVVLVLLLFLDKEGIVLQSFSQVTLCLLDLEGSFLRQGLDYRLLFEYFWNLLLSDTLLCEG